MFRWSPFTAEDVRQSFLGKLNDVENWLYSEEGEGATRTIFADKLAELTVSSSYIIYDMI
jgi:hypothetical protein